MNRRGAQKLIVSMFFLDLHQYHKLRGNQLDTDQL